MQIETEKDREKEMLNAYGSCLIPVYVNPVILDAARKFNPISEIIPRELSVFQKIINFIKRMFSWRLRVYNKLDDYRDDVEDEDYDEYCY